MTIELRPRAPAPAGDDDAPQPARRRQPPRYAPKPAAKPPPQAVAGTPASARTAAPPSRARARDAQAARDGRQADLRRERPAGGLADADPQTPGIQAFAPPRDSCRESGDDGAGAGASADPAGTTGTGGAAGSAGAANDDAELEAGLQGLHDQQGIFELLLPGGQSVGVVVQSAAAGVHFLLSAGGGALEQRLRQNKMELERRLQQRMQKDVRIAVL
ncbi:hypothetical protein ACEN9F_30930 [Duganella sp. CT11-25]|uniref:hypothetical protein n=1 Tax=unclassified Duganella TaxID=2636909 RepID=UPI0039AF5C90